MLLLLLLFNALENELSQTQRCLAITCHLLLLFLCPSIRGAEYLSILSEWRRSMVVPNLLLFIGCGVQQAVCIRPAKITSFIPSISDRAAVVVAVVVVVANRTKNQSGLERKREGGS